MLREASGLKATLKTQPVCPSRVRRSCPVSASHMRTVLSSPAEASIRPPAPLTGRGLKATLLIQVPMSMNRTSSRVSAS